MCNAGKKVVLFGLDGTPYTLLNELIQKGVMPNFANIVNEGTLLQMDAVYPEVSYVSWSSFMTGKNPAKHGIFGFTDLKPNTYSYTFPNYLDLKSETIWDVMEKYDKRSVVINMPATYPAKRLNGVLVSGFIAIDLEKSVYPYSLLGKLREIDYALDVDVQLAKESLDKLLDNIFDTLEKRIKMFEYLWEYEMWDLFIGVITGTDRLHHFFWDAYEDESHNYHERFLEYYKRIDTVIGSFYERLPKNTTCIMISDHGFTRINQEIYLRNLFVEKGLMNFKSEQKDLEYLDASTLAFVLDPGRVYINVKGKYPEGSVESGDQYEEVVQHIIESVISFEINGVKPIKEVLRAKDIYEGKYLENGPDLIITSNYGYDLKATLDESKVYGKRHFTGMHTYDDAFLYINQDISIHNKPNIMDIAPTILKSYGINPSSDMDGTALI